MSLDWPPEVDPESWQEYLEVRDQSSTFSEDQPAHLTEEQYWALLAVYEPATETLITGSDGPGYHVPLMQVLSQLGYPTISRSEAVAKARQLLDEFETCQAHVTDYGITTDG